MKILQALRSSEYREGYSAADSWPVCNPYTTQAAMDNEKNKTQANPFAYTKYKKFNDWEDGLRDSSR
jgi:hypothetical protein